MTCLMLAMQSAFCTAAVLFFKGLGVIKVQGIDLETAKKWFPISFMLATVIYTGSKSLVSFCFEVGFFDRGIDTPTWPAISQHTCVHDLQEFNNHSHRKWVDFLKTSKTGR